MVLFSLGCSGNGSNSLAIPYPYPRPDSVALPFLPGIVSTDSLDFNLAFSPDGKTIYFTRTRHGKWIILQSTYDKGKWTQPIPAPFSEAEFAQADPFVGSDGSIYYISNRPRNVHDTIADFDIWFVKPLDANRWTAPINLTEINTDSAEYYVSLAENGNLYFASTRAGGYGGLDIYLSRFVDGKYTSPENLGAGVNTSSDEHDPLILGDEQYLIFNSFARTDSYGEADLYYSTRMPDNSLGTSKNMGPLFNTPTYEYCPNLSPDKKFFFFSSEYDVKWIPSGKLPFGFAE